jgi:esterase/lipase superfamily enzyme
MPPFLDLFEGYFDENIYYNVPCMFVPNISDKNILAQLRKLRIMLGNVILLL